MMNDTRMWDLKAGDVFRFVAFPDWCFKVLEYVPATNMREEYWRVQNLLTGNISTALSCEEVELVLPACWSAPEIPDTIEVFLAAIGA